MRAQWRVIGIMPEPTKCSAAKRLSATAQSSSCSTSTDASEPNGVPSIEIGCVKDFPGAWAEYRVFERGVLQVHRRASAPAALAWADKTRAMFGGAYVGYAFGALEDRCLVVGAE